MQIFRRTIKTDEIDITKQQRDQYLLYLQKLIYSSSEEHYQIIYTDFCKIAPSNVLDYFNSNWHHIRNEWVKGFMTASFGNATNNRIESFNQKLKSFVEKYSYMTPFMNGFFPFIQVLQNERDSKVVNRFAKHPTFYMDAVQQAYYDYLTPFAYKHVDAQIQSCSNVLHLTKISDEIYSIKTMTGVTKYETSITSCSCVDFESMGLPCRHILKVRSVERLPLFDSTLCNSRWSLDYLKNIIVFLKVSTVFWPQVKIKL